MISKSLAADPDYAWAHDLRGYLLLTEGRNDEALAEFERTLALDPSIADADAGVGWVNLRIGSYADSAENIDKAVRVSPHDPSLAYWSGAKALVSLGLKRYDEAIAQFRQTIAINPNYIPWAHVGLIAALALTGHDAEAREALQRYLALPSTGPLKTVAAWKAHLESRALDGAGTGRAGLRRSAQGRDGGEVGRPVFAGALVASRPTPRPRGR